MYNPQNEMYRNSKRNVQKKNKKNRLISGSFG